MYHACSADYIDLSGITWLEGPLCSISFPCFFSSFGHVFVTACTVSCLFTTFALNWYHRVWRTLAKVSEVRLGIGSDWIWIWLGSVSDVVHGPGEGKATTVWRWWWYGWVQAVVRLGRAIDGGVLAFRQDKRDSSHITKLQAYRTWWRDPF